MCDEVSSLSKAIRLATVVLVTMGLQNCTQPSLFTRAIIEEDSQYVRLLARYGDGQDGAALKFAHPVSLSETEWGRLLSGVYIQEQKKLLSLGTAQPAPSLAFDEDERRYLAKYLAEGFHQARPDEWVVFYLSRPREPGMVEIASGGFSVEGGQLHLVFGNYRQPVSMSFIQRQIWNDPLRPAGESFYEVIPQNHQSVRTAPRRDLTQSLLKQVSELVIDYRAALARASEPSLTDGASQVERGIGGHREGDPGWLEERLRTLNRLRDQGLITEEEFRSKRERLLEHL